MEECMNTKTKHKMKKLGLPLLVSLFLTGIVLDNLFAQGKEPSFGFDFSRWRRVLKAAQQNQVYDILQKKKESEKEKQLERVIQSVDKGSSQSSLNVDAFNEQFNRKPEDDMNPFIKPIEDLSIDELSLTGIVYNPSVQYALINGLVLKVGEKIGDHLVTQITRKTVTMKGEDGVFKLTLKGKAK